MTNMIADLSKKLKKDESDLQQFREDVQAEQEKQR